jgi:hypothetical protein
VKRRDAEPMIDAEAAPLVKEPGAEPLPGYRLIEPLGKGGFGEVWKCEVPGGLFKAIKFVNGAGYAAEGEHSAADQELDALTRIKTIRHPFILSIERAEVVNGELLIVTELADKSLREVLQECRRNGMPGIPRDTLLALLLEAAEALDVMNFRYGLQHLDIKPANLFLVSEHLKVADFGQVDSLCDSRQDGPPRLRGSFTALYAAPEILQGAITRHSDQYSLAVVYQELLTGGLPYTGKNARQLLLQRLTDAPSLEALPPADRPVVARALSRDPSQRYPSCLDFVKALRAAGGEMAARGLPAPVVVRQPAGRPQGPAAQPAERQAQPVPVAESAGERRGEGAERRPARGLGLRRSARSERRISVRYRWKSSARARVRARPSYRSDDVHLRDISVVGVGLVFEHDVERGTSLFVQLPGRRAGTTTTHLAEVVHVIPWEQGRYLVGCKWARPLSDRDLLDALGEDS